MSLNKFSQYPERTELNPTPIVDQTKLVAVTNTATTDPSEDILAQAQDILPGVAFNSVDGDPKPMISGVVWNEQEQLREAFTEGVAFTLPHFRYMADDYLWKSIVGDKAFYYFTSMNLVTWPLTQKMGVTSSSYASLHLEWLRAPDQTQIFKFTDASPNSTWNASLPPAAYGNIILKNRTQEMVSWDPMEVRVNECSTSTKLKEVRVAVKSKDASPLYVNFPGADVSLTIPQLPSTTVTPNVTSTLANVKMTSDTTADEDAICAWRTFTLNTQATVLSNCFNVDSTNFCSGTVYVNAPSVTTLTNCFTGSYTPGAGVPDVRINLSTVNQDVTFFENFPLGKESILYLLKNLNTSATDPHVLAIGIDAALTAVYGETQEAFMILDEEIQAEIERLDATGKWSISWKPISTDGGGLAAEYQIYDYMSSKDVANCGVDTKYQINTANLAWDITVKRNDITQFNSQILSSMTHMLAYVFFQAAENYLQEYVQVPYVQSNIVYTAIGTTKYRASRNKNSNGAYYINVNDRSYALQFSDADIVICVGRILGVGLPLNCNFYTRKDASGNLIGLRFGQINEEDLDHPLWQTNLLPCKRLSDGFPGLYDTMRTNPATGTHFFPASAKDAFTCHYEQD